MEYKIINPMYLKDNHKKGPLVIFLHGVGSSSNMWRKHMDAFKEYHCIAPDLPGHGKSNHIKWTNLNNVSEQIFKLIKRYQQNKVYLVGLSLGGSLVINLLSKHPEIIDKAIVDGAGIIPIKNKSLIKFGVALVSPFLKFEFINKTVASALGITNQKEYKSFKKDMELVDSYAFRTAFFQANDQIEPSGLNNVKSEILFVCGQNEDLAIKKSNEYLANKIKGSKSYIVPNKGHGWLASSPELHIIMTKSWFEGETLPEELKKL